MRYRGIPVLVLTPVNTLVYHNVNSDLLDIEKPPNLSGVCSYFVGYPFAFISAGVNTLLILRYP